MAGSDDETTPPGWYRQKDDPATLRWWDGDDWTDDTMPAPEAVRSRHRATPLSRRAAAAAVGADEEAEEPDADDHEPEDEAGAAEPPVRITTAAPASTVSRRPEVVPRPSRPTSPTPRPEGRRPTPRPEERRPDRRSEDDWAADAWEAGARTPSPSRTPAATRIGQRATPEELADRGSGPQTSDPRRPRQERRPPTPMERPAPRRMGTDPRPPGPGRSSSGSARPPGAPRSGSPRPGTRPGGPRRQEGGRPGAPGGARRDERVVQRGGTVHPGVRVALRALLIAVLLGAGYLAYTQLRDAEAGDARTLTDSEAPAPTVDPDAPRLDQVVLALNDLPRGWSAQAVDASAQDDICDGRVPLSVIEPLETTKAAFTQGEAGPFITNVVSTFADDAEAEAFLDLTARTVASCRAYEVDGGTSIELGPLEFPSFGDQSFAAEAVGTSPYGDLAGDIIYVRVGRRVTSVETIAFGDSTISPELVEHLTRLVAQRMD